MKIEERQRIVSRCLLFGIQIFLCVSIAKTQSIAVPDGYAGYSGTTGGGNATPVTVTTASEFDSIVGNDNPAVIIVKGRLDVGNISIGSNKTILGFDTSSGLYGGIIGIRGSNYILQNLTLGPSGEDVLEVSGATKVFITKCDFFQSSDELCSIVREADYVTVSWCKFYFPNPDGHSFAHLIGNDDNRTSDRGKLHVTLHHNWYAEGVRGRMPRVRFGHVHIYNNYYNSEGNGYCIGVGYECHIRVENTYFENINDPWADYGGVDNGEIGWSNLKFVGCSQPTFVSNSFPVFTPPYLYGMDPVENVKSLVMAGAGNVFGSISNPVSVSITTPSDSARFSANSNITIEADASVDSGGIASVKFLSDSLLSIDSIPPYSYIWENVEAGIYSLRAAAIDSSGHIVISHPITIFVGSGITITEPLDSTKYTVPPNITIGAKAWDEHGTVSKVEFYHDGILLGSDVSSPYSITWNNVPPGTHKLLARATDNNSNISISDEITIYVTGGPEGYEFCSLEGDDCNYGGMYHIAFGADGKFIYKYNVTGSIDCSTHFFGDPNKDADKACYVQAAVIPYITVTYPNSGAYFAAPASITIKADALDNDGTIDSVHFYQNENLLGVSYVEPYTFLWENIVAGEYSITAIATDNDGNSAASEAVSITVVNRTGSPERDAAVLEIYPNPASDMMVLSLNDNYVGSRYLVLYNSVGETILINTFSGSEYTLDLKTVPEGLYILCITNDKGRTFRKIIKSNK